MSGKWEGHIFPAPVIATTTPFFSAGPLPLRGLGIIEKKARVAFQGI